MVLQDIPSKISNWLSGQEIDLEPISTIKMDESTENNGQQIEEVISVIQNCNQIYLSGLEIQSENDEFIRRFGLYSKALSSSLEVFFETLTSKIQKETNPSSTRLSNELKNCKEREEAEGFQDLRKYYQPELTFTQTVKFFERSFNNIKDKANLRAFNAIKVESYLQKRRQVIDWTSTSQNLHNLSKNFGDLRISDADSQNASLREALDWPSQNLSNFQSTQQEVNTNNSPLKTIHENLEDTYISKASSQYVIIEANGILKNQAGTPKTESLQDFHQHQHQKQLNPHAKKLNYFEESELINDSDDNPRNQPLHPQSINQSVTQDQFYQNTALIKKITSLKKEIVVMRNQIDAEDKSQKFEKMEILLAQSEQRLDYTRKYNFKLKKQAEKTVMELQEMNEYLEKANSMIIDLKSEISHLHGVIESLEQEIDLRSQRARQSSDYERPDGPLELRESKNKIKNYSIEIFNEKQIMEQDLQQDKDYQESDNSSRQDYKGNKDKNLEEIENLSMQILELKKMNNETFNKLKSLKTDKEGMESKFEKEVIDLSNKLQIQKSKNNHLSDIEQLYNMCIKDLERCETIVNEQENIISKQDTKISTLKNRIKKLDEDLLIDTKNTTEINNLKNIEELNDNKNGLSDNYRPFSFGAMKVSGSSFQKPKLQIDLEDINILIPNFSRTLSVFEQIIKSRGGNILLKDSIEELKQVSGAISEYMMKLERLEFDLRELKSEKRVDKQLQKVEKVNSKKVLEIMSNIFESKVEDSEKNCLYDPNSEELEILKLQIEEMRLESKKKEDQINNLKQYNVNLEGQLNSSLKISDNRSNSTIKNLEERIINQQSELNRMQSCLEEQLIKENELRQEIRKMSSLSFKNSQQKQQNSSPKSNSSEKISDLKVKELVKNNSRMVEELDFMTSLKDEYISVCDQLKNELKRTKIENSQLSSRLKELQRDYEEYYQDLENSERSKVEVLKRYNQSQAGLIESQEVINKLEGRIDEILRERDSLSLQNGSLLESFNKLTQKKQVKIGSEFNQPTEQKFNTVKEDNDAGESQDQEYTPQNDVDVLQSTIFKQELKIKSLEKEGDLANKRCQELSKQCFLAINELESKNNEIIDKNEQLKNPKISKILNNKLDQYSKMYAPDQNKELQESNMMIDSPQLKNIAYEENFQLSKNHQNFNTDSKPKKKQIQFSLTDSNFYRNPNREYFNVNQSNSKLIQTPKSSSSNPNPVEFRKATPLSKDRGNELKEQQQQQSSSVHSSQPIIYQSVQVVPNKSKEGGSRRFREYGGTTLSSTYRQFINRTSSSSTSRPRSHNHSQKVSVSMEKIKYFIGGREVVRQITKQGLIYTPRGANENERSDNGSPNPEMVQNSPTKMSLNTIANSSSRILTNQFSNHLQNTGSKELFPGQTNNSQYNYHPNSSINSASIQPGAILESLVVQGSLKSNSRVVPTAVGNSSTQNNNSIGLGGHFQPVPLNQHAQQQKQQQNDKLSKKVISSNPYINQYSAGTTLNQARNIRQSSPSNDSHIQNRVAMPVSEEIKPSKKTKRKKKKVQYEYHSQQNFYSSNQVTQQQQQQHQLQRESRLSDTQISPKTKLVSNKKVEYRYQARNPSQEFSSSNLPQTNPNYYSKPSQPIFETGCSRNQKISNSRSGSMKRNRVRNRSSAYRDVSNLSVRHIFTLFFVQ